MKIIIALMLTCLSVYAQTTYPLITDRPQRVFSGGGTNIAGLTNSQTFTGTNTFPAAKFFAANGITFRSLLVTNVAFVGNASGYTNTPPPYYETTHVASFTVPALLTENSVVRVSLLRWQTNAVANSGFWTLHGGAATNFLSAGGSLGTTAVTNFVSSSIAFKNNGSFTQQVVNLAQSQNAAWQGITSIDTSAPWLARLGITHSGGFVGSATNQFYGTVLIEEVVLP
jgi:hypothetical protein